MNHQDVITFWFDELEPKHWFAKDFTLDKTIADRFGDTLTAASACELYAWRDTPEGRLAEIIVLDQFSRNIHRDTPLAFATDNIALALAQEALKRGDDQRLKVEYRNFMYMPYMHSESALIHTQAVELFSQAGAEFNYEFELKHKAIIDTFGRYPHRNAILGRESTPKEIKFLNRPDSSF